MRPHVVVHKHSFAVPRGGEDRGPHPGCSAADSHTQNRKGKNIEANKSYCRPPRHGRAHAGGRGQKNVRKHVGENVVTTGGGKKADKWPPA